jgi:ABC-type lipoprotein release transport system permease subunit
MLLRAVIAFGAVGTLLGVATVIVVYRMMGDFHAELMQQAHAAGDRVLLDMIADNSRTMMLILAAIVLVAALNIGAGVITLMRQPEQN